MTTFSQGEDTDEPDRLVTLAVVYSLREAVVMQATLRAYGIPCFSSCEGHAYAHWYAIPALGGIAIYVPSSLRDAATTLVPDLANPRSKVAITAEIRANGGPYARKRLLIAHLMVPVLIILLNPLLLISPFLTGYDEGIIAFLADVIDLALGFGVTFLHPALGLIAF